MATQKQKKVAQILVNNLSIDKPLNGGEVLEKVGYSKNLVKQPGRVIQSVGVQEELKNLGFDSDNAKRVVAEILNKENAQDKDRLKAADMIFDVHGDKAPEKHITVVKKVVSIDE